ncbi:aminopeptidase N [Nocardioides sp.]|uniref:aminopeptidase N n=1 Tax=Nocardioides sp. TaxID=35761 RepID=UPI0035286D1F
MSLTWQEARARSRIVGAVAYEVFLDLTDEQAFTSLTTIRFESRESGATTFLELADAEDVRIWRDGVEREATYVDDRIVLSDLRRTNEVRISARLPYVGDGEGMHTMVDVADGERYTSALCGMDVAQRVFACFDQPDLKATVALSVAAPSHWTVLANGRVRERTGHGDHDRWTFSATPRIPPYLFVLCGGPWYSHTWERSVRTGDGEREATFGWHVRGSQAALLDRDSAELRRLTDDCFDHYQRVFTEPYPFDDYHQVFVAGLTWGAMEMPGAVTFHELFLPRGEPTPRESLARAEVIAHEMAHMWFGDLVTMRWWEDSWLNESFADYMGYAVGHAVGHDATWVDLALARKPTAYRADRRRSTHPVAPDAADVVDVDTALGNFDMITYAKGNAVLRQLVTWLGEDTVAAGSDRYLTAHRFDNADLADYLDALDGVTDRDVRGWADGWLRTTGFDVIEATVDAAGVPVLTRLGSRPHRLGVTAFDHRPRTVAHRTVDLESDPVRLTDWSGLLVVPNTAEDTYALVRLDSATEEAVASHLSSVADPLARAMLWAHELERCESGDLSVPRLRDLVERHLGGERHPIVFVGVEEHVVRWIAQRFADPDQHADLLAAVSEAADRVVSAPTLSRDATRVLIGTSPDLGRLRGWLTSGRADTGVDLDPALRWDLVRRLVAGGDDPSLVDEELQRDRSTDGQLAGLRARAASPTDEAKRWAWTMLLTADLSGREFQALGRGLFHPGHHALVTDYLWGYLEAGPGWVAGHGQGFARTIADIFPWLPLPDAVVADFRAALADTLAGSVPTLLRRRWADALDDLDAVLTVRGLRPGG